MNKFRYIVAYFIKIYICIKINYFSFYVTKCSTFRSIFAIIFMKPTEIPLYQSELQSPVLPEKSYL